MSPSLCDLWWFLLYSSWVIVLAQPHEDSPHAWAVQYSDNDSRSPSYRFLVPFLYALISGALPCKFCSPQPPQTLTSVSVAQQNHLAMLVLYCEKPPDKKLEWVTLGLTSLFVFTQGSQIGLNYLFSNVWIKGLFPLYILFNILVVYNGRASHSSYLVMIGSECLSQLSFHWKFLYS